MDEIHKLIIKARSASTACGIGITAFYPQSNRGLSVDDAMVSCSTIDSEVRCEKCVSHARKSNPTETALD